MAVLRPRSSPIFLGGGPSNIRNISLCFSICLSLFYILCGVVFPPRAWGNNSATPLVYFFPHGGCSSYTRGRIGGFDALDIESVGGGLVAALGAPPALGEDDALLLEAVDRLQQRLLGEPDAPIQRTAVARPEAVQHLREADGIGLPLEAEGPPHDVEQHLELGAGELREQLVEELVGHLGVVGTAEAPEG